MAKKNGGVYRVKIKGIILYPVFVRMFTINHDIRIPIKQMGFGNVGST